MAIFHEYPYTNFHDLNLDWIIKIVKELKAIVDTIDVDTINSHFATIDGILAEHTADIAALQAQSTSAAAAISSLQTTVSSMEVDITQIHSQIDGVIDQIAAAVSELTGDVSDLETELDNYRTATDSRLTTLEQAAFDPSQIVFSNMPFNFALSTLNGNKSNMRIVVDGSGASADAIQWVDGGQYAPTNIPLKQRFNSTFKVPRFYSSGNQCHLVIPSIIPIKYSAAINWSIYFYANRWIGGTSGNVGICKVGPINFTDLLADGGVQQTTPSAQTGCFNDIELFANQETGCYDLYIFNGRDGKYTWINDYIITSLMVLPVDLGNVGVTAGIQKYFNLLNSFMQQSTNNVDAKITSAVSQSQSTLEDLISVSHDSGLRAAIVMNPIVFNEDPDVVTSITRNFSKYSVQRVFDHYGASYDYYVKRLYVDLTMVLHDVTDSVDVELGQFAVNGSVPISMANSGLVNIAANAGVPLLEEYASVGTDGTLAMHLKGLTPVNTTMTVRINGYIEVVEDNLNT